MSTTPAPMAQPRDTPDDTRPARARTHFAGLDGVRALAAVMVVVHHATSFAGEGRSGPLLADLGAVADTGVGLFFVLSGFLIYRPFAVAGLDGTAPQATRSFWWRRLLRIVPAYWLVLTVFWAAGSFDLGPPSQAWRYYGFVQVYDRFTTLGGIPIAWSLNTEMTFYLMVPVWGWLVRRVLGRGRSTLALEVAGLGLLFAGAYVSRAIFSGASATTRSLSFLWLPTNLDLFAGGMLLAVLHAWATGPGRGSALAARLRRVFGQHPGLWLAVAAALYAWYALRVGPAPFDVGYRDLFWQRRQLVVLTLGTCLIAPLVFGGDGDPRPVRRLWSLGPVHWLGLVSYGLYLWHYNLMQRVVDQPAVVGRGGWEGLAGTPQGDTNLAVLLAVGLGVGALAAAATWYLLERPLQRFKDAL